MPPGDYTPSPYTSMQQQAGLLPAMPPLPQVVFPGQISALLAQGGGAAAMSAMPTSGMFQGQMYQTMTGAPAMYQGPTGIMQPQMAAAPFNPYPGPNPYASMGGGPMGGPPSPFTAYAPAPPPAYAGFQGQAAIPFAPPPAMSAFNSPYSAGLEHLQAANDRAFAMRQSSMGLGARVGADAMGGFAGAAIGARLGGRFGAIAGAVGGFLGMEGLGGGQAAQNAWMDNVAAPMVQQRGMAGMIEHASQSFVPFGGSMHARGGGFSHHASEQAANGLMSMANSSSFRRETFDRFNGADVGRITQGAAHEGMMSGVTDPSQMTGRVREIAKSLSAFMELAKEPDIQRALATMGSLRASGLNLNETMGAVSQGRSFARMAGMSFQQMAETGGAMGSSTFQSMGLTQGLGFRAGMADLGSASASQNGGILNPQMMGLVGGAQGYSNLNNMFSAGMLQLPMMAPGMMSAAGGLSASSVNGLLGGQSNLFSMTGRGANVLSGMAARGGVESLGMAIGMQPMLQDHVGRMLQADGPFSQRNAEDGQVMQLSRNLGMRGSAGFMTAAQAMGMSQSQALARAQEMGSGAYWDGQRGQIETRRREGRAEEYRRQDAENPSFGESAMRLSGADDALYGVRRAAGDLRTSVSHAILGDHAMAYNPMNDDERREMGRTVRGAGFGGTLNRLSGRSRELSGRSRGWLTNWISRQSDAMDLDELQGGGSLLRTGGAALAQYMMSADEVRGELRNFGEGRRLTGMAFSTTDRERAGLAGRTDNLFGNNRAMSKFGQEAARIMGIGSMESTTGVGMGMNAGMRAGVMALTGGMIDPGNIAAGSGGTRGTDLRAAYIRSATAAGGMDMRTAASNWDRNSTAIMQLGSRSALEVMTPEQRERAQASLRMNVSGGRTGSFEEATREEERRGVSTLLGSRASTSEGEAFAREMQGTQAVGNTDEKRERSRAYTMARAQLIAVASTGGTGSQRAQQQLTELRETARRQGFSHQEIDQMDSAAGGRAASIRTGPGLDRARQFAARQSGATGAQILSGTIQGSRQIREGQGARLVASGVESAAAGSGPLADIFQGMNTRNFDSGMMQDRIRGVTDDQIAELRRTGQGRVADMLSRARNGDERAMGQFREHLTHGGERRERIRTEVEEGMGLGGRLLNRFTNRGTDRIADLLGRTTVMDSEAERQQTRTDQSQAAAQAAGIGGGGDQLVQASRSLEEASRMLRDTVQGRGLDGLVTPP